MSRLSDRLDDPQRASLTERLVLQTVSVCERAGADAAIVTADPAVSAWAFDHDLTVIADPGRGLDVAARIAVDAADGRPWLVVHADLPLLSVADIEAVVAGCGLRPVLAPSHDGGTSVAAATTTDFPFRYGPGSFRRHLGALRGRALVLCRPGLALDLDQSRDLAVADRLGWRRDG